MEEKRKRKKKKKCAHAQCTMHKAQRHNRRVINEIQGCWNGGGPARTLCEPAQHSGMMVRQGQTSDTWKDGNSIYSRGIYFLLFLTAILQAINWRYTIGAATVATIVPYNSHCPAHCCDFLVAPTRRAAGPLNALYLVPCTVALLVGRCACLPRAGRPPNGHQCSGRAKEKGGRFGGWAACKHDLQDASPALLCSKPPKKRTPCFRSSCSSC